MLDSSTQPQSQFPVVASGAPPRYARAPVVSKVDPFKEWICEQLQGEPSIPSLRLREMATRSRRFSPWAKSGQELAAKGTPASCFRNRHAWRIFFG